MTILVGTKRSAVPFSMPVTETIYEFSVKDFNGKEVSLADRYRRVLLILLDRKITMLSLLLCRCVVGNCTEYSECCVLIEVGRGRVVIVVNVASQCGLTPVNYTQLKEILDTYKDRGLAVAAFPCNQFADQEPGCAADIENFVKKEYSLEPDLYAKVEVNGDGADPLWKWLRKQKSQSDSIKWNFTKFLVNRRGEVIARYGPTIEPKTFINEIEKALAEQSKL